MLDRDRVLRALENGDTALDVARKLTEPQGTTGRTSCRRVVAALNALRGEGRVRRRVEWVKETRPARWSHP